MSVPTHPPVPPANVRTRIAAAVLASLVALPLAFVAVCLAAGQDLSAFDYTRPAMFVLAAALVCGIALAPIRRISLPALLVAAPVLTFMVLIGLTVLFGADGAAA